MKINYYLPLLISLIIYTFLTFLCFILYSKHINSIRKTQHSKLKRVNRYNTSVFHFKLDEKEKCEKIFNKTSSFSSYEKHPDYTSDQDVLEAAQENCDHFYTNYAFLRGSVHLTQEEKEFPIAYSLVVHTNAHQVLQLLSAIYSPQNVYCIHIDLKSPDKFYKVLHLLASCFSNVILTSKRENVVYASFSRLQADLNCMSDLLKVPTSLHNWTYLMNLCGQDYPLKTNLEIVRQIKKLKNHNQILGSFTVTSRSFKKRTKFVYRIKNTAQKDGRVRQKIVKTGQLKSPPPFNITLRKNSAYNIYTRRFLQWVLFESEKAKALLHWSRDTLTPDEHYWLMLDALPEAPGRTGKIKGYQLSRYIVWFRSKGQCKGLIRHYNCVFGTGDLPTFIRKPQLFANKFDVLFDATPITCLRTLLESRWVNENGFSKMPLT